jgi:serine-type D-Ala-D-Ala endopeptidase (penicillin-binding protein 7)
MELMAVLFLAISLPIFRARKQNLKQLGSASPTSSLSSSSSRSYFPSFVSFFLSITLALVGLTATDIAQAKPAQKKSKKAQSGKAKAGRHAHAANGVKVTKVRYVKTRSGKLMKVRSVVFREPIRPALPSFGQLAGLHATSDPLELKSGVALVMDQHTNEVLFSKNAEAVLPIASITKLMTAMVVLDGRQSLDDIIEISDAEIDTEKNTRSRLTIGTALSRSEMLHLALMSSENRAAHSLGRSYAGGTEAFVRAMNAKAAVLGMNDSRFADPTGLSNSNRSSARDLAKLVQAAHSYPIIRRYSTDVETQVANSTGRVLNFNNTNRLVKNPDWQIGLQKTGFISEAGQCLVMQAFVGGRSVIMVFLDSFGKLSRIGDASRVRKWLEDSKLTLNNAPAPLAKPIPTTIPTPVPAQIQTLIHTPTQTSELAAKPQV